MKATAKEPEKSKEEKRPDQPSEDPGEETKADPFGKWIKFVYETTFVLVVLTLGTLAGIVIGVLMPVAFPFVIFWQRYALPRKRLRKTLKPAAAVD